eukprot:GDKI01020531.1.p1 GENE.GDKI01020531.1~~GDKI01020531.1.p1  ORF type:complete len:282 (+),score=60.48 GDKI01020531.1:174-1019(+)
MAGVTTLAPFGLLGEEIHAQNDTWFELNPDQLEEIHDIFNYATAFMWFCGYAAVLLKLRADKSALGLSQQTLLALFLSELNNVVLQVYLSAKYRFPLGLSFYFCDLITTLASLACFMYVRHRFANSYEKDRDTFGLRFLSPFLGTAAANKFYWVVLYLIAFAVALPLYVFRRSPLGFFWSMYECFDDALLAVALIPQLFMFYNKRPRKVSSLMGRFVVCLFFARCFALTYWVTYPLFKSGDIPSRGLHMATEILNILILADFCYYYLKAKMAGQGDIALPI